MYDPGAVQNLAAGLPVRERVVARSPAALSTRRGTICRADWVRVTRGKSILLAPATPADGKAGTASSFHQPLPPGPPRKPPRSRSARLLEPARQTPNNPELEDGSPG